MCFNLYLPFNIAIAAVIPIEKHDRWVFWNCTGLRMEVYLSHWILRIKAIDF